MLSGSSASSAAAPMRPPSRARPAGRRGLPVRLRDWPINGRLVAVLLLLSSVSVIVAWMGLRTSGRIHDQLSVLGNKHVGALAMALEADRDLYRAVAGLMAMLNHPAGDPRYAALRADVEAQMARALDRAARAEQYVTDPQDRAPLEGFIGAVRIWQDEVRQMLSAYETGRLDARGVVESVAAAGERHLPAARSYLDQLEGRFAVRAALQVSEAGWLHRTTRRTLAALAAAGIAAGISLGWAIGRTVTGPVIAIRDGLASRAARVDLTGRLPVSSADETGQLAAAVNGFLDAFRTLILKVRAAAQQVAASSGELASSSDQVGQAARQMAQTIDQVARGAERQSARAQAASEQAREMGRTVESLTASAHTLADEADQATRLALQGRQALEAIVRQMDQIRQVVDESGQAAADLGNRSTRIGQVVDAITAFADQTNLLALNAAIEAARAGEHGRGFAVVAEEVRKLAEQSRLAATEIGRLVGEIRQVVDRVVQDARRGQAAVVEGVESVGASGKTFEAIAHALEGMVPHIGRVGEAARQLEAASRRTIGEIVDIASITQQSAAAAQELAATAQEQSSAIAEVARASRTLADLAGQLLKDVDVFKV